MGEGVEQGEPFRQHGALKVEAFDRGGARGLAQLLHFLRLLQGFVDAGGEPRCVEEIHRQAISTTFTAAIITIAIPLRVRRAIDEHSN